MTPMLTPLPSQMLASSKPNQAGALLNIPANSPSDKRSQLTAYEQSELKRRNHFNSKLVILH